MTVTLVTGRRDVLEALGGGGVYTTTGSGSTTTLVCFRFASSALPTDHLDFTWVHVPSIGAPRQKMVAKNGLTPGTGTVTFEAAMGASVGSGVVFELSNLLPLVDEGAKGAELSLNQCVQRAHQHLAYEDTIELFSVANQQIYSLAGYAAWLRDDRILALEDSPVYTFWPNPTSRFQRGSGWGFRYINGVPKIEFYDRGYGSDGHLWKLRVMRPAWTVANGVESTTGTLAAETDYTNALRTDVRDVGLMLAYRSLSQGRNAGMRGRYQALYEMQLARCRQLAAWDRTQDVFEPAAPAAAGVA